MKKGKPTRNCCSKSMACIESPSEVEVVLDIVILWDSIGYHFMGYICISNTIVFGSPPSVIKHVKCVIVCVIGWILMCHSKAETD